MTTNESHKPRPAPCDPDCPGFAIFNEDECPEIQLCIDCGRFKTDLEAMQYMVAMAVAAEKSGLRPRALADGGIDPHGGPWLPTDSCGRPLPAQDHDPLVCSGCGAEGVTICKRVNLTTGAVETDDAGAFPYCPRCHSDDESIAPIPRSQWTDPGPGDCVEQLLRLAQEYCDGKTIPEQVAAYFQVYGPGLVRKHSTVEVLAQAVAAATNDQQRGALNGKVGAAFLSSVYECF